MNDLAMKRVKRLTRLQRFSPIAIFLALFIIMTIVSPTFLQRASVMNLLKQCAVYGILAIGETFVIMGGSGFWHRPAGTSEFLNAAAAGRDIYDGLNVPMAAPFGEGRMLLGGWMLNKMADFMTKLWNNFSLYIG